MSFMYLASDVIFETTDEEGHLLQTTTGICLDLDLLATLFLQVALFSETKAQVLATLGTRVDATKE